MFGHLRRVVALTSPETNSSSTGARAGAVLAPGAPGAVLFDLVGVFPHAVTFVAPLQRKEEESGVRHTQKPPPQTQTHDDNTRKKCNNTTWLKAFISGLD